MPYWPRLAESDTGFSGLLIKTKEQERMELNLPGSKLNRPKSTEEDRRKLSNRTQVDRHKRSRFRKKQTSLAILVGILNKEKEKNNAPGKHPGNSRGKVYLLMFSIKGAGLET